MRGLLGSMVHSESEFKNLASLLALVDTAIHGDTATATAAKATLDTMEWLASYPINGGATAFIGYSDYVQRLASDEQNLLAAQIRAQTPIFGFAASQGLFYCDGIGVASDPVPTNFLNTQNPLMIMGSTRDGLTQHSWAAELAHNFRNSRVITYVGTQHTPYLSAASTCVDNYGTNYLLRLQRPAIDMSCPNANVLPLGQPT